MRRSSPESGESLRLPPPASAYLTPAGVEHHLASLAAGGRGLRESAGSSREGRIVPCHRFGPDRPGGVLLISWIHAVEWIGPLALLDLARRILEERPLVPLTLLPVANPDGVARAARSVRDRLLRLDRGNAAGVDINRNFPPTHRTDGFWASVPFYRPGAGPGSEPEVEAIIRIAERSRPRLVLSFHSFGRWIFYPPAHRAGGSGSADRHRRVLDRAGGAASIGYAATALGGWSRWFRAYGAEIDYFDSIGALGYIVEVSRGGFGRWGLRRIFLPFYAFNPPDPEEDVRKVADLGLRLVDSVIE